MNDRPCAAFVALSLTVTLLAACSSGGAVAPTSLPSPLATRAEPFVAKGRATDAAGRPLEGVEVYADYRLVGDFALDGTTDRNGDYRLELSPPESSWLELTLTPDGPLIDGSAGKTITSIGDLVEDVAAGRYTYSARYVDPGEPARDLEIRVRDTGDYAATVTADFEQISTTGQQLELQVRSIGGG